MPSSPMPTSVYSSNSFSSSTRPAHSTPVHVTHAICKPYHITVHQLHLPHHHTHTTPPLPTLGETRKENKTADASIQKRKKQGWKKTPQSRWPFPAPRLTEFLTSQQSSKASDDKERPTNHAPTSSREVPIMASKNKNQIKKTQREHLPIVRPAPRSEVRYGMVDK